MQYKDFIFWVGLPPGGDDLRLLEESAGIAEPLIDLRYGSTGYQESILENAVERGIPGLTAFVDCRNKFLIDLLLRILPGDSRVVLTSTMHFGKEIGQLLNEFRKRNIVAGIEVDSRKEALQASLSGADFIVASANEAYGLVSVKTSLILIQELLEGLDIPMVIRGSLGPQGVAGAFAAGCSGCILDSQLLLLPESPLSDEWKSSLHNSTPFDATLVGTTVGRPYRLFSRGQQQALRNLVAREEEIFNSNNSHAEKIAEFENVIEPYLSSGFSDDAVFPPVGQGIAFAQQFAEDGLSLKDVVKSYNTALHDSLARIKESFPFMPESVLARRHGTKLPIVQGPMTGVTAKHALAVEVSQQGGLPFVSTAALSPEKSHDLILKTRKALGKHPFGAGLVLFADPDKMEEQVKAVISAGPDFVTIAGGDPDLCRQFEEAGLSVYIHAPSLIHVKEFLDKGVRGLILEGHEAGGHVGALSSLILWELAVRELLSRKEEDVSDARLLFAGGLATHRSAVAAAALAAPLIEREIAFGLQLGTAYLMADEAVKSGAIPVNYHRALLSGNSTLTTGHTINLPSRWLATPQVMQLIEHEHQLQSRGIPLNERKKMIERSNLKRSFEGLGKRKTANIEQPREESLAGEEHAGIENGIYSCGQIVSVIADSYTVAQLHENLTIGAKRLADACPMPAQTDETLDDSIAIIGMGCLFPGANNINEYWENIIQRVDTIREVPRDCWNPDLYYDPERSCADKTYSKIGAFVEGFEKDPLKFRIPPVSAQFIDRIQFMTLETAHQALEDAGYLKKPFPNERTAVFMGNSGGGELRFLYNLRVHWLMFAESLKSVEVFEDLPEDVRVSFLGQAEKAFKGKLPEFSEDSCGGSFGSLVAGRISNCFNLGGSALVLDGACASSLAAVDMGVTALREGRVDLVLAGGVDVRNDAATYIFFSSLGAISAKGSFPFDERADGFVIGEGAGMVLLKRLGDAVRDGDKIYAVIRSVGASTDGRVKGITAPDAKGQIRALEHAYESVSFTPDTVSLLEAHGTSTWVGDFTEMTSLVEFIRRYSDKTKFIGLGSVKSNIGHLKAAAGIAGLIKTSLALYNKVLPPTINCEQPRKDIDWENSPFYLLTEHRPWKEGYTPRRAAVESFGFGGINYHAVLEEAPREETTLSKVENEGESRAISPSELLIFRASTRAEVLQLIESTKKKLVQAERSNLREIAFDLMEKKSSAGPTLAIVASDDDKLIHLLNMAHEVVSDQSKSEFTLAQGIYFGETPLGQDEKVAFLFPGQGSQYLNMGGDLPTFFPFIEKIFKEVDSISRRYIETSILPMLSSGQVLSEGERARLQELLILPEYNHPAMLAMGMGILETLKRAGVQPDIVAGHSLGEYLALQAAGVFDIETAIRVMTVRGCGIAEHCLYDGAMASVSASPQIIEEILEKTPGFVVVANKNCPAQTVISGEKEAVEYAVSMLENDDIQCQLLSVSKAFHSPLLKPSADSFRKFLDNVDINTPDIPVQCNLTGDVYKVDKSFEPRLRDTLSQHLVSPVEFIKNVQSMYEDGARLFVEVGPGSTLSSFVDNILADRPHWTVPTNLPRRSAALQMLHGLALCAARGLPVDIRAIMPKPKNRLALQRTRRLLTLRTAKMPDPRKSEKVGEPGLIDKVLVDQPTATVESYLRQRGDFLKDMIRLDFEHFMRIDRKVKKTADDNLEKLVVDIVSQKTGYQPDLIDIDLDVEAELGLDSIKQVEIIREFAKKLNIDFGDDTKSQRYEITTLRKLIERARNLISSSDSAQTNLETTDQGLELPIPEKDYNIDCHRWVCEKIETPLPGEKIPQALKGRHALLLAGEDGPGPVLKSRLEEAGATVSVLSSSCQPEDFPADFDLVLNMWAYTEDWSPTLDEIAEWWEQTARRASAALRVGQNLIKSIRAHKNRHVLWVEVTSLGGELGARSITRPSARAGIGLGMSRSMLSEFPDELEGLYLDFDPLEPLDRVAACVLDELTHERMHFEIGYAQGKRFEIRWKVNDSFSEERKFHLDSKSVVLAIGGARGITASICRELANRTHAQFIVVGRSPFSLENGTEPQEPIDFEAARKILLEESLAQNKQIIPAKIDSLAWELVWKENRIWNMNQLLSIANNVEYIKCDITDAKEVRKLVDELFKKHSRIDLVIQGGGDLVDKSTEDFDPEEFISGMKSKALGTACLLAALSDVEVDVGTFINLSSIAGRWGSNGQSSYAAGHEVASILVTGMRGKRTGKWINIFYGPWLNVGMTRIGVVMERLRKKNSAFITDKAGSEFTINELSYGPNHNVGYHGNESFGKFIGSAKQSNQTKLRSSLLDEVHVVSPGIAEGRRIFDLSRDQIVAEHYVHLEHPVLPGVVSLEMIAQTACALTSQDFAVTDLEDVTLPQVGTFPRAEPREFRTRVSLLSKEEKGTWFAGEVFSLFTPPGSVDPKEIVHARCKIRFGHREAPQRPSLLLVSTGIEGYRVDANPLWKTKCMKRRLGIFRNIHSLSSASRDGTMGEILAPIVREFGECPLLDNPVCLDASFFLSGLPTLAFQGKSFHFFGGAESIKFFASDDPGEVRFCRSRIREINESRIICDIEIIDRVGRVVQILTGLRKFTGGAGIDVDVSERIWDSLRENPVQTEMKRLLGYDDRLILAHVPISLVEGALEANEEELLREHLSEEEIEEYRSLSNSKRKLEWLAGRIVAKGAVRMYLGQNAPPFSDIKIRSSTQNAPYVVIDGKDTEPHISISHSNDMAVAVAAEGPGIGIDVEKVDGSILEICNEFSSDDEVELLSKSSGYNQVDALSCIWAVKESSRKAIGPEIYTMKELVLAEARTEGVYIVSDLILPDKGSIKSITFQNNGYAYAVSISMHPGKNRQSESGENR